MFLSSPFIDYVEHILYYKYTLTFYTDCNYVYVEKRFKKKRETSIEKNDVEAYTENIKLILFN